MNLKTIYNRRIHEFSPTAILLMDRDQKLIHLNDAAEQLLKISCAECLGKPAATIFPSLRDVMARALARDRNSFGHTIARDSYRMCVDLLTVALDRGTRGLIAVIRQMQWGKLESLGLFKANFPAILDSFRDGIWICNDKAEVVLINLASEKSMRSTPGMCWEKAWINWLTRAWWISL